ncbi:MAG: M20/M25/M40 family metallo-hydrolase [Dehalococcoidia bacterium]|nr:M20/M25/M40 family metallo-hydrolase [Dehalococcoidia bacterium]
MTVTEPRVDWDAAFEEALGILQEYLRIDTSNPPGRERLACDYLGGILEREGVEYELFDPGDDRVSLRAVLKGDGSRPPLMLLNHTDVVPVEREFWDEEPFAGIIRNGEIWGRGTLDMKGLGVAELLTFLLLKRAGVPLARDIVFLAVADEEAGGLLGIEWLAEHHPEALEAEFVINEGGGGSTELFGVKRPVFTVTTAEKGPLWLRVVAEGRAGHGSVPHNDNPLDRLVRALGKLQEWERTPQLSPVLEEYFGRLERAGIYSGGTSLKQLEQTAASDVRVRALLTNTISATTATAGMKHNVIPGRAEATIDCRLLPGVDPASFEAELTRVIDDPKVRLERVFAGASDTSSHDTELFATIESVVRELVEDAVVTPGVTAGFTDSRVFRNQGVVAYGFSGGLTSPSLARTVHGHNERMTLDSFRLSCQMIYEVTRRMCEAG